jgi:hypothetical protein
MCKKAIDWEHYLLYVDEVVKSLFFDVIKMTKSKKTFDNLDVVMTQALVQMWALVENGATQEADFIRVASVFLIGLMSTAADMSEIAVPGSSAYFYAEIEAAAKNGGLRWIKKVQEQGGNSYSISNIANNDLAGAMNYLGQELSVTLFKHLNDLPKPLRTIEMLVRGVEVLMANLLHQKFNSPKDPHATLDSFCEHVHMALDDLAKRGKPKLTIVK